MLKHFLNILEHFQTFFNIFNFVLFLQSRWIFLQNKTKNYILSIVSTFFSFCLFFQHWLGRALPIVKSRSTPILHCRLTLPNNSTLASESIKISSSREVKDEISNLKFSASQSPTSKKTETCFLRKKIVWNRFQTILEVFAPNWVVNKTGLLLQYHITGPVQSSKKI